MAEQTNFHQDTDALLEQMYAESVERYFLDNGLTVLFKNDNSAELASVQVWVKTGSIHEDKLIGSGVSHYLEHMLFKGTEKRTSQQLTEEVHQFGGYVNAYTSYDRTVYYIDTPSEAVEQAMDILSDMAFNSTLPQDEAIKERDVILREIDMGMDDPDRQSFYAYTQAAFREHPYRYPVIGLRPLYEQVTPEELGAYYQQRYAPNNMVLVVVGAIESDAFRELVDKYFSQAAMSRVPPVYIPEERMQLAARRACIHGDYNIVRGMMGYPIPGLTHGDSPCLDALSSLLGNGQSSVLNRRLREELKLVHQIETSSWNPGEQGVFWISYLCDIGKREQVEEAVFKELDLVMQNGLDEELLAKAVRQAIVGEVNVRKTMSGQASRLGMSEVVVGDLGYSREQLKRLSAVTVGDLSRVAQEYFVPSRLTAISLEPKVEQQVKASEQEQSQLPDFEEVVLANGARLLLQPRSGFPKVHFRTVCLGGSLYEDAESSGATGVLATLLTKDTEALTAEAIAEKIEALGGSFSEFAGNNTFGHGIELLSGDYEEGIQLLEQSLLHYRFREEVFELERDGQLASILEDEDDIVENGRRYLRERFFEGHPYAVDSLGTVESVKNLNMKHVAALAEKLLVGPNVVVSVSGQFDRDIILKQLSAILEKLPDKSLPKIDSAFTGPKKSGELEMNMDREQAVVFQAYPDVGISHEDYYVSEVLDELFSGMSSRLFMKVREEKGLAYYVGSSRMVGIHCGMFYFYGGTQPSEAQAVLQEVQSEVERVQAGGIEAEELMRCKTRLKVQKRMGQQPVGARAMSAALNALYGLPVNAWRDYDQKIDSITIEALQDFAKRQFTPENVIKLIVKAEEAKD